jgi:hypothetical protein
MDFSIVEALEFGWHKTRQHSGLLFQVLLSLFALQVVSAIVGKVLEHTAVGFFASLGLVVLSVWMSAGATRIILRLAGGHATHLSDLLPPAKLVWHFFCASVLAGLAILAGFALLILPGVFLLVRLSMVRFAVLDGADIVGSLRRSWHETHGHFWRLLGFFLALVGLNVIGAILFIVGLLITIPVSVLAYAHVYLKLKKAS